MTSYGIVLITFYKFYLSYTIFNSSYDEDTNKYLYSISETYSFTLVYVSEWVYMTSHPIGSTLKMLRSRVLRRILGPEK
jgi:hypothetical protein